MPITDFFRKKTTVSINQTYGLTPLGKTKAEEFSLTGSKWQVLACLSENGASSVSEIADELKTSPEKIKSILKGLIRSGYVKSVSNED